MPKELFLLDAYALIYRAHYAFISRPLINSKGLNTSAISGFTRFFWDILKSRKPPYLAVAFDTAAPTFRHQRYPLYKANREEQPEDITTAVPYIKRILQAFHIPDISLDGYEADDLIGTLAFQAADQGFKVFMATSDKDYGQLVRNEQILLYKPGRRGDEVQILNEKDILKLWQVKRTNQIPDMLGLQGDSSDNIPGVPGIGPKTAAKLIQQYDSVENLLQHLDELKGKVRQILEEYREQALLSKELATIDTQAPVTFEREKFRVQKPNLHELLEIFEELEFRTLKREILSAFRQTEPDKKIAKAGVQQSLFSLEQQSDKIAESQPQSQLAHVGNTKHHYQLLKDKKEIQKLIQKLNRHKAFAWDTETTDTNPNIAEVIGMSFSVKTGEAQYVPVPEEESQRRELIQAFRQILSKKDRTLVGQNIKYDILVLKWMGVEVDGPLFDTMIAHYLLAPEQRHNLNYLSEAYLKYSPVPIEQLIGKKGKNQLSMKDVPLDVLAEYAAEDADLTWQLYQILEKQLQEEGLYELYQKMEAPLIYALAEMEYNGITLDADFLKQYGEELKSKLQQIEEKIFQLAGTSFNINSPRQIGEILFEQLKIPYRWSKTKTGQYSTNEEKLSELAHHHPVVREILNYRSLSKLISTYVEALPRMINSRTGRIHSSFNQALTATGRLSSNNPNLQNIPIRTPEGARVREAFIPRSEEYLILSADYSQIELRLIASISGEEAMLEAFRQNLDIHRATAARVFGVPYEEVTREQRNKAKTVNFSIIYGAGATNLSRQLGISRKEAAELIQSYFEQYPGLKAYMQQTIAQAREKGYVTTLMGRRRYLRDINSRNGVMRSHAERNAINTPIQGSAADLIKIAMVNIHQLLKKGKYRSKMILQVHDELLFDLHKEERETLMPLIEEKMRTALPNLKVPILVDMGVGKNWLEAH